VGAKIHAEVDGAPGENDMPGALVFSTTPDGVSGPYQRERLRITAAGNITIGAKSDPAWHSSVDALTIGYAGVLYEDSYTSGNDNYVILGNNTFYNAANGANTYIRNDEAQRLMMQSGNFWFQSAATGAAGNAITFVDRLRISSNGNIAGGLKYTLKENATDAFSFHSNGANGYLRFIDEYDNLEIYRIHGDGAYSYNTTSLSNYGQSSNNFSTAGGNTGNWSFRRDTGAVIHATDADSGWSNIYLNKYDWSNGKDSRWINFYLNGAGKDSITWNGSNIVYGQSSDYRIKKNVRDFTSGIDKVKQLKVHLYDYIDTERGTDHIGFIAHELQEVIPEAVEGVKDGMRKEEDTDELVPAMQSVEYGKITPVLTAALQEALAKIETLEARITALES
jgi:hypothetical protein